MRSPIEWGASVVRRCSDAWTASGPPYSYAVLRILFGALCLVSLAGLTPVEMYWPLDGIIRLPSPGGPRAWLVEHGLGTAVGWVVYLGLVVVFSAMTLGVATDLAVLAAFIGLVGQNHWNTLPLSSAHQVLIVLTFCLVWAECGRVWSIDAWRSKTTAPSFDVATWPLFLMRWQIAVIYCSSGLHKLGFPVWRDGSAVHWALNLNYFHRLPWPIPPSAAVLVALLTWSTLLFELAFPVLVCFRKTRIPTLIAGIALHVGLWATLELGPFSWIMIASYVAFLDPETVAGVCRRLEQRIRPAVESESAGETLAM